jgi:hypothetical protein
MAVDPLRDPAALSNAISRRWRPYRFRAYMLGAAAGLLLGGFVAPIATTIVALLAGDATALAAMGIRWDEVVWTVVFVLAFARVGSWAIARWLPRDFRAATETYLWLAVRAEGHWQRVLGSAVPRTAAAQRTFLDGAVVTPADAAQIASIWLSLGDVDTAREVAQLMPESTPVERHEKAAAAWLIEFVGGADADLGSLETSLASVADERAWLEGRVELAIDTARAALVRGADWMGPMAAIRDRLGDEPSRLMWDFAARPAFRTMLWLGSVGVVTFWVFTLIR